MSIKLKTRTQRGYLTIIGTYFIFYQVLKSKLAESDMFMIYYS